MDSMALANPTPHMTTTYIVAVAAGVVELAISKIKSLRFATEAAITILRIDDRVVVAQQQQRKRKITRYKLDTCISYPLLGGSLSPRSFSSDDTCLLVAGLAARKSLYPLVKDN